MHITFISCTADGHMPMPNQHDVVSTLADRQSVVNVEHQRHALQHPVAGVLVCRQVGLKHHP
jgi:hypothetical protein